MSSDGQRETVLSQGIRQLRKKLGLTQRTFGEHLGVPQSSIYRWEAGLVTPNGRHLKSIHELAELHGVPFQPFEESEPQPSSGSVEERLAQASLRLIREQLAFCETLESAQGSKAGDEAWRILGPAIQDQRARLARFLGEIARDEDQTFHFWKAVSNLHIFSWREDDRGQKPTGYVSRRQMSASTDPFQISLREG